MSTTLRCKQSVHRKTTSRGQGRPPLARLLALLVAFALGCDTRERAVDPSGNPRHHRLFADSLVNVIAKPYPEFKSLPDNEHSIRYLHAYSRDMHELLHWFLENHPADDPDLLHAIRELDDVTVQEFELHAKLIAEQRFNYTESEQALATDLRWKSADLVGTVAGFVTPPTADGSVP